MRLHEDPCLCEIADETWQRNVFLRKHILHKAARIEAVIRRRASRAPARVEQRFRFVEQPRDQDIGGLLVTAGLH